MAARRNNAFGDEVFTDKLFAEGTFWNIYEGMYTCGPRKGQRSIMKVFKDGAVYEDSFFHHELAVVDKAMEIIQSFNKARIIDQPVYLNEPEIWEVASSLSGRWEGQKTLCEPLIKSFHKYNSNTGWHWNSRNLWHQAMQALSHFSYHSSGGQILLCDL